MWNCVIFITNCLCGIRTLSIWECCAIAYCCSKVKSCCESTGNKIKAGCKSITEVCNSHNEQVQPDLELAGGHHIDSAGEQL